jgi:hypothetical protein
MTLGPGKYDYLCTKVREEAGAGAAIVIVTDGIHGHGISCQTNAATLAILPQILRDIANMIEDSYGKA